MLFLSLRIFQFLTYTTFLLFQGLYKTFLAMQMCWQQISTNCVWESSPLLLKDNSSEYRILGWWFLSQHFKHFTLFSFCFHCFWSEVRSHYLCSSICKICFFLQFLGSFSLSLILCNLKLIKWGINLIF